MGQLVNLHLLYKNIRKSVFLLLRINSLFPQSKKFRFQKAWKETPISDVINFAGIYLNSVSLHKIILTIQDYNWSYNMLGNLFFSLHMPCSWDECISLTHCSLILFSGEHSSRAHRIVLAQIQFLWYAFMGWEKMAHLGEAECCPLWVKRVYGRWSSHPGQVGLDQRLAPLRLTTDTPPPRVAPISVNDNVLVKSFATSNCHRNHLVVIPRARYKLFIILQVFLSSDFLL